MASDEARGRRPHHRLLAERLGPYRADVCDRSCIRRLPRELDGATTGNQRSDIAKMVAPGDAHLGAKLLRAGLLRGAP